MKEPILSREEVRAIFTAHGFTIKEGQTDLKQYVYDAAAALESAILEKLCVEPIYQIGDGNELWRDVKRTSSIRRITLASSTPSTGANHEQRRCRRTASTRHWKHHG